MKKVKLKNDNNRWLLTYSDLITLLMVLFIMLYAASNMDKEKYKQISTSFKAAFNINDSNDVGVFDDVNLNEGKSEPIEGDELSEEEKLKEVENNIEEVVSQLGLEKSITSSMEDSGILISINDNLLFENGDAELKDQYKTKLVKVAEVIKKIPNDVQVEGHTDNIPIENYKYKSNWQLSAIRAANVVEFLSERCKISPNRLSIAAYGEYKPKKENSTQEGRAINRRVNILILKTNTEK